MSTHQINVGRITVLGVGRLFTDTQGQAPGPGRLARINQSRLFHLGDHQVPAFRGPFGIPARIVVARSLDHSDQQGDLVNLEVSQGFTEIELTGQTKAVDAAGARLAQVNLVQVGFKDIVFLIVPFQQHRHQRFVTLAQQGLLPGQEEVLHQLLRQRAPPLDNLSCPEIGQHGAGDGQGRDAKMVIKMLIFHRHQGCRQQLRYFVQLDKDSVFLVGRVDATDLCRLQAHDRCRVTTQDPEVLDPVTVNTKGNPASRLLAVRKAEAPGTDHEAVAIATVASSLATVSPPEAGELQLPLQGGGTDTGAVIQFQRPCVYPGGNLEPAAFEPGGHHSVQVHHPAGKQHQANQGNSEKQAPEPGPAAGFRGFAGGFAGSL